MAASRSAVLAASSADIDAFSARSSESLGEEEERDDAEAAEEEEEEEEEPANEG